MSLINEALKKAQRQTHPESPASVRPLGSTGLPYSTPGASPAKPPAPPIALILAGAGVLVSISVLATVWLLRVPPPPVKEAKPAVARHEVPPAAATGGIATVPDTAPVPAPLAPRPALPVAAATTPPPAPTPAVAVAPAPTLVPSPARPTLAAPPQVVAPVAPVSPPPAVIDDVEASKTAAQKFIDEMRISGVRQQGADSKVLINGRVYRLNEIVDRTLGLRLTQVHPTQLTFTDRQGAIYTREF